MAPKLNWSAPRPPDDAVWYYHSIAETPFGRIMITWKGHKAHPDYDVGDCPWETDTRDFDSLEEAQLAIEAELLAKATEVMTLLDHPTHPEPT